MPAGQGRGIKARFPPDQTGKPDGIQGTLRVGPAAIIYTLLTLSRPGPGFPLPFSALRDRFGVVSQGNWGRGEGGSERNRALTPACPQDLVL